MTRRVLAASAMFVGLSCSDMAGVSIGPAASLDIVSGDLQTAVVGGKLADPLVVRVTDAAGHAVPGQIVNFKVTKGGGSVFAGSALTNAEGKAQERWTIGTSTADTQVVEVRAVDPGTGDELTFGTFKALGLADVPANLEAVTPLAEDAVAGSGARTIVVGVRDKYDNPVPNAQVSWSVPSGNGSLSKTTDVTTSAGKSANSWTIPTTLGTHSATASALGLTAVIFTSTVTGATAADLHILTGSSQTAFVNATITVTGVIRDSFGNLTAGSVVLAAVSGGGSVPMPTVSSGADGAVSFQLTLGNSPGSNTFSATVGGSSVTITATAEPTLPIVIVNQPNNTVLSTDTVTVTVTVSSTVPIASVRAIMGTVDSVLVPASGTSWSRTLGIGAVPFGTTLLEVRVTDALGRLTTATRSVVHDKPPTIAVTSPAEGSLALPTARVTASCVDDDPGGCIIKVGNVWSTFVASASTAIDTDVNVLTGVPASQAAGPVAQTLMITATDSRGRVATASRDIYAAPAASFAHRATAPAGLAWDYVGNRLLYGVPISGGRQGVILDLPSGSTTAVPVDASVSVATGRLTPGGAFLCNSASVGPACLEWRNGILTSYGERVISEFSLDAAYVLYAERGATNLMYRRQIATGTDVFVAAANPLTSSVAANGDAVFESSTANIVRYRDGVLTEITNDNSAFANRYPQTDGSKIVYLHGTAVNSGYQYQAALVEGSAYALLTPSAPATPAPVVNNGWVGYVKLTSGVSELYTRSPDGTTRHIATSNRTIGIIALSEDGRLVYLDPFLSQQRFFAGASSAPVSIGVSSTATRVILRDGKLLALIGPHVLEIIR
jgi:hypothetical protein